SQLVCSGERDAGRSGGKSVHRLDHLCRLTGITIRLRRVLILGAQIKGKRPGNGVACESAHIVKAFGVRAAVIVDDSLSKVQAVVEWGARNSHEAGVNRVHIYANIGGAI